MEKFTCSQFIPIRKNGFSGQEYLSTWESSNKKEVCEFLTRQAEENKIRMAHKNPVVRIAEFEIREI